MKIDKWQVCLYAHLKYVSLSFCLNEACLKESWAGRKGDPGAIKQVKKKKKSKKKAKGGEHNQNREKKLKKKKSKLHDEHSDKQKIEEGGLSSDEDIQRSVPLHQDRTELWSNFI